MESLTRTVLILLVVGCVCTCSGPTEPEHKSFYYPLAVGNQWVYEYTEISVYSDSTSTDTVRYKMTARVICADTILPGIVSYTILEDGTNQYGDVFSEFKAYVNMPEGMYAYYRSRQSPQIVLPKSWGLGSERNFVDERWGWLTRPALFPVPGLSQSEIDYYDPTPLVLPYPQQVGHRWTVVDSAATGAFGLDKKIAGWETVTTPAGTFDCVSIDLIYTPPLEDVEISSRFAAEGLIRRTVNRFDIAVTTVQHPTGTGETKDIYATYELQSFTLNSP